MGIIKSKPKYRNALDPVTGAEQLVSSIFGFFTSTSNAKAAADSNFAQAVLAQQKAKNTQTIFIVGGITLASLGLIGLAIYLAVKRKRI